MEIPKYTFEDRIWYRYLHITGGSGDKGKYRNGGQYDYCVTYLRPDEFKQIEMCIAIWCRENKLPFGLGSTIQEAYDNYLKAVADSLIPPQEDKQ